MQKGPPRSALRFLRWFCRKDYLEEIEGDLTELFEKQSKQAPRKASWTFFWRVLKYFRPEFIKAFEADNPLTYSGMIKHNFLITYRGFLRNKTSFLINLAGLSTGLAAVLLIYLWVTDELSVDKFHQKDAQLYQVLHNNPNSDGVHTTSTTPGLLAKALAEELPEVEYAASVVPPSWFRNKGILSFEKTRLKAHAQYIDQDYFNMFSCDFTAGSKVQLLRNKQTVAISEDLAMKLFNTTNDVIGKVIFWDMRNLSGHFEIAGIFSPPPGNATEQFELLFNYALFFESRPFLSDWGNSDPSTFLVLREGTDLETFNRKITKLYASKRPETDHTLFVRKYSDQYLYNHYENGVQAGGRIEYVHLFSLIALFLLVIGCANFMNLSTARAEKRTKEIGVKKTLGASRKDLVVQYLGESMIMAILSTLLAWIIVILFLPHFNQITGKELMIVFDRNLIGAACGITLFTGFFAGSYPAIYLSGFHPIDILKGGKTLSRLRTGLGEQLTRKGLVVFQFALSTILIVSVWIVHTQIAFVQTKNLGYNQTNLLHFELNHEEQGDPDYFAQGGKWQRKVASFLNEVQSIPGVSAAYNYNHNLTGYHGAFSGMDWEEGDEDKEIQFKSLGVGFDFIETMEVEMVAGRSFSQDHSDNDLKLLINEEALSTMGLSNPIGKTVRLWHEDREIIGVVKNFHFESLYEPVKPCVILLRPGARNIMAKIQTGKEADVITQLEKQFAQHYPGFPFEYRFIDEDYQVLYAAEQRVTTLSRYFAGLAILISCLGLFGLAAFTAERRNKEIGIRKILGSSVWGIVSLLSTDFTRMVLVAILIALPISYLIAHNWLEGFAYKIELQWWFFAGAAIITLLIAWLTVGFQTLKAAIINPAECLRDE